MTADGLELPKSKENFASSTRNSMEFSQYISVIIESLKNGNKKVVIGASAHGAAISILGLNTISF
jgi:hypothetical protein